MQLSRNQWRDYTVFQEYRQEVDYETGYQAGPQDQHCQRQGMTGEAPATDRRDRITAKTLHGTAKHTKVVSCVSWFESVWKLGHHCSELCEGLREEKLETQQLIVGRDFNMPAGERDRLREKADPRTRIA